MIETSYPGISWLPKLTPLEINTEPENRPEVSIYELLRQQSLFVGKLWPDFSGTLLIDLKPLIKDLFVPSVPSEVPANQTNYVSLKMRSDDDAADKYVYADVNLFSEDSLSRMSDADELTVPEDYILPIAYPDDDAIMSAFIETRSGKIDIKDSIVFGSGDCTGQYAMLKPISALHLAGDDTFRVLISTDNAPDLRSPVYHITSRPMEQYLFYNRLGGWDNIAMGGRRTVTPEMDFSNHLENGLRKQTQCKVTRKYVQNSGWMTLASAEALVGLLSSPAVYHLVGGIWRQIVVVSTDIVIEDDASQHSLSFTYSYSEED